MKRFLIARVCSIFVLVFVLALIPGHSSSAATPERVQNFRLVYNGNKSAVLAWNKAKNASYYLLYQYNAQTGEYKKIGKTSACTYQVKRLKVGQIYQYAVQSVFSKKKKTVKADYSDLVAVEGRRVELGNIHGRRWSVITNKSFTAKDTKTGETVRVKKGTTAVASAKGSTVSLVLKNGAKVKAKKKNLKYDNLALADSYDLYSQEQAEGFVNQKGYSSKTDWLIWISQYTGSVHVFKGAQGQWQRKRVAKCVVGKDGHTVTGVYRLLRHFTTHGKPAVYFTWNNVKQWGESIHCRIDSNTWGAFSSGCIRLGDSDLNYLIKHCPLGTTVVSL